MTDTDANPDLIDFPVPSNDDAIRSIQLMTGRIADAVLEGLAYGEVEQQAAAAGSVPVATPQPAPTAGAEPAEAVAEPAEAVAEPAEGVAAPPEAAAVATAEPDEPPPAAANSAQE